MRLLIVNYHYIREQVYRGGIYPVSPQSLRVQVESLARHYKFVSQQDLLSCRERDSYPDENLCLLTFDDGLREQAMALDVLKVLSIPALCFPTVRPVAEGKAHDVHKLHRILAEWSEEDLETNLLAHGYGEANIPEGAPEKQYLYDTPRMKRIKYYLNFVLQNTARDEVVDALFSSIEPDEHKFARELYMGAEEWKALAQTGQLGCHGWSHSPLAKMEPAQMRQDIQSACAFMEKETGEKVKAFSYPYGSVEAVSDAVEEAAKDAGLGLGFTMTRGFNAQEDLRRGLRLRRVDTNDAPGGKSQSETYRP